ncbi:GumC family protein [Haliangium ochraceum]|uniref:non-specific protein-tyrosine kinase n=1 Tax=Haliangium ochraceum (strain DSM 14365 / JCM 11303 / SMP-2) TaxID=502025 RepID=D0LGH6_HALO1|nr:polysaccharide biosynthesis tyrosine autokinase [Haliangium ochraceum]ACY12722.1 capsular exopolysaccharide family [Haliangium ochraceum DSM 14365]
MSPPSTHSPARQETAASPPGAILEDERPALDLARYWRVVRKRAWLIAAVVAVGVTASVLYTRSLPKIYQATASVVIDPTPPQVFGSQVQEVIQLGAQSYWSNQEYYNTQLEIFTRFDLVERTLARHPELIDLVLATEIPGARSAGGDRDGGDSDGVADDPLSLATERLAALLTATQTRESRVVRLRAQHTEPAVAEQLANYHVDTFLAYHRNLRGENTEQITEFLDQELVTSADDLENAERALLAFKKDNDILSVSIEDRQNILAADIARYNAALSDARIERIELGTILARARALEGEAIMESPIFALASSTDMVEELKAQYIREKHKLAELSQELGPRHPAYQAQNEKVEQQYAAIEAEARRALRELSERHQAALARERQLGAELERLKAEAFELGDKTAVYKQLERKQHSEEEKYNLVLSRLGASQLSERNTASNVHLHMRARSAELVYPRVAVNLGLGGVLSLLLGLGLAFLLDFFDRTIKSPEQVEQATGAPLLGMIPAVEAAGEGADADRDRARDLFVFDKPRSAVAEHCRSIRTNILFSTAMRPTKVLTISSPRQGEGKTTTAIYLGTIMAQSGQRVLLVDTDMRRPRLHQSLGTGTATAHGLSELLLPETRIADKLDQVIVETAVPGLFLLPCGAVPPNPAELLLTERFGEVLDALRERFDRVLLDSPPLMLMNDAVVLSRRSDGVVMVARAGRTAVEDLSRSGRMVRDVDAPVLGVILNGASTARGRYGGYERYGYAGDDEDGGELRSSGRDGAERAA